ncbi:MAG: hypothetical protein WCT46_00890 [Candidatus Gracilibacteria bacterium]|jgi:hypothetical protein
MTSTDLLEPVDYGLLLAPEKKAFLDRDFYETGFNGDLCSILNTIYSLLNLFTDGHYSLEDLRKMHVKSYEEYMKCRETSGYDSNETAYIKSKTDPAKVEELNTVVAKCNEALQADPFDPNLLKKLLDEAYELIYGYPCN